MGRALYRWKAKEKGFPTAKEHAIEYLVREIRPQEVLGLKVGNSRECPRVTPHDPRGGRGTAEGCISICMGSVSEWRQEAVTNSL